MGGRAIVGMVGVGRMRMGCLMLSLFLLFSAVATVSAAVIPDPITPMASNPTTGPSDGTQNYTGEGYSVAILNSGVNKSHVALADKVIDEICVGYISPVLNSDGDRLQSLCTGSPTETRGNIGIYHRAGAATTCTPRLAPDRVNSDVCMHGTAVAGAAAMDTQALTLPPDTVTTSGTAKGAKIIAVVTDAFTPATSAKPADLNVSYPLIIAAMNYLLEKAETFSTPLAAVNFSGGGSVAASSAADCRADNEESTATKGLYDQFKTVFEGLRNKNIAPVISNGNDGDPSATDPAPIINQISFPACVEGAVSVGATDNTGNAMANYSQNAPNTALLATGGTGDVGSNTAVWGPSGRDNENYRGLTGTSIAAPHIAGAFAVLRQKFPDATVAQLTSVLKTTGKYVRDTRAGYNSLLKPLIQLNAALAYNLDNLTLSGGFDNNNSSHVLGTSTTLAYTVQKDYVAGLEPTVTVDNEPITQGTQYTISPGSTKITLTASYLNSLTVDPYDLKITYPDDTTISAVFNILPRAETPRPPRPPQAPQVPHETAPGHSVDPPRAGVGPDTVPDQNTTTVRPSLILCSIVFATIIISRVLWRARRSRSV